ncbi:hypothetical protein PCLA_03r0064 [Pseudomonas citronellolis]|nr:hypothetical protein PCLA_03r0064 [Pseudomonas citronellolis]
MKGRFRTEEPEAGPEMSFPPGAAGGALPPRRPDTGMG